MRSVMIRSPKLYASIAEDAQSISEAQRLRYRAFRQEAASSAQPLSAIDHDRFDDYCEHLIVCENTNHRIVGTYRILGAERAAAAGGFYSDTEFDLSRIDALRARMVEVGRACVDESYRDGTAIALLWKALLRYMTGRGYEYVIGCASIPAHDPTRAGQACQALIEGHLAPPQYRVFPHRPFDMGPPDGNPGITIPPLIHGYLRLGAQVCGDPFWDEELQTADLFLMLWLARLNQRYAQRLLRAA